jgi:hypothetical protein
MDSAFEKLDPCLVVLHIHSPLVTKTGTEGASQTNTPLNGTLLPFSFSNINWYRWFEILLKSAFTLLSQVPRSVITITVLSSYAKHWPCWSSYTFQYCNFIICIFHDLRSSFLIWQFSGSYESFLPLATILQIIQVNDLFHQLWLFNLQFHRLVAMHIYIFGFHSLFYAVLIVSLYNFRPF